MPSICQAAPCRAHRAAAGGEEAVGQAEQLAKPIHADLAGGRGAVCGFEPDGQGVQTRVQAEGRGRSAVAATKPSRDRQLGSSTWDLAAAAPPKRFPAHRLQLRGRRGSNPAESDHVEGAAQHIGGQAGWRHVGAAGQRDGHRRLTTAAPQRSPPASTARASGRSLASFGMPACQAGALSPRASTALGVQHASHLNQPKKRGDCQCVMPGMMCWLTSARICSMLSGCSGAWSGRHGLERRV